MNTNPGLGLRLEVEGETVAGEKEELQVFPRLTSVQGLVELTPPGGLWQGEEGGSDRHLLHGGQSEVVPPVESQWS